MAQNLKFINKSNFFFWEMHPCHIRRSRVKKRRRCILLLRIVRWIWYPVHQFTFSASLQCLLFSLVPALLGSGHFSSALSGGWAPTSPPSPTLSGWGGGRNSRNQLIIPWDFVRTSVKGCLSKSCHQACPGMVNLYFVRAWLNIPVAKNGFGLNTRRWLDVDFRVLLLGNQFISG